MSAEFAVVDMSQVQRSRKVETYGRSGRVFAQMLANPGKAVMVPVGRAEAKSLARHLRVKAKEQRRKMNYSAAKDRPQAWFWIEAAELPEPVKVNKPVVMPSAPNRSKRSERSDMPCGVCGARGNEACIERSGKPMEHIHTEREGAAPGRPEAKRPAPGSWEAIYDERDCELPQGGRRELQRGAV